MREDRRDVDAAARARGRGRSPWRGRRVPSNSSTPKAFEPITRDLLEVERRPFEAPRHLDAGDDDRATRRRDPQADFDGLAGSRPCRRRRRRRHRTATACRTTATGPRRRSPSPTRCDDGLGRLVREAPTCAPNRSASVALVREARDGEDARSSGAARAGSRSRAARACRSRRRAPERPRRGGRFRTPCSDTENGSASTACSSRTPSGIGMHIDSCAGTNGAKPPVAALLLPVWMPGGITPLREVAADRVLADLALGARRRDAARTAREPGIQHDPIARLPRRARPDRRARSVPTTSCPSTCGNEMSAVIGLSMLPFRKICL